MRCGRWGAAAAHAHIRHEAVACSMQATPIIDMVDEVRLTVMPLVWGSMPDRVNPRAQPTVP